MTATTHTSEVTYRHKCFHEETGLQITIIEVIGFNEVWDRGAPGKPPNSVIRFKKLVSETGQPCAALEVEGERLVSVAVITCLGKVVLRVID